MSRAHASRFGTSRTPKIPGSSLEPAGSTPGQVKPETSKLIQIHGYTAQMRAETNSLLDMVRTAHALHRQEGGSSESITEGGHR